MVQRFQINLLAVTLTAVFSTLAIAQEKVPAGKNANADSQRAGEQAAITRGSIVYGHRCEICHSSESDAQKYGSSMKGIYKRGKFADGSKVNDASIEKWIVNGGKGMPSYKEVLNSGQIRDLIAYIKTL
ncbi:MAG: cytochrome c [Acidobacteriia bacterium]|nr:cytochrome c [Terriglobia bacterium]